MRGGWISAALAVFALAVHGYHPYAEDGGLYLAGAKRLLDPALFPHGAEFVTEPSRYSGFAPLVAESVRLAGAHGETGFASVVLLLHLTTIWATLFGAWLLAGRMFAGRSGAQAGAVLLLACWLSLPVAGTALLLMDPYLTARSFATPCLVLGLVGAWDAADCEAPWMGASRRRGWLLCGGCMGFALLLHPLMAAYGAGSCLLFAAMRRRGEAAGGAICAVAVAAAGLVAAWAPAETSAYLPIALTRTYWFVTEWRWYEWMGIVAPLGIVGWFGWARAAGSGSEGGIGLGGAALCRAAVLAGATATAAALLFARPGQAAHLVARLQPMREIEFAYLVMVLLLGGWLGERLAGSSRQRWATAAALLSAPLYSASRVVYAGTAHVEMPGAASRNPWVGAFVWIRENTPRDALFALDADYIQLAGEDAECFRAIAERSALPDRSKDGGEAAIAPELTAAWNSGQAEQNDLPHEDDARRRAALRPAGVSWIVLPASSATVLRCPYANGTVRVCRLD